MKSLKDIFRPHGRGAFVRRIRRNGAILDIGCGNNSPAATKMLRPDCRYTGIDIGDYNQSSASRSVADEYVLCSPEEFAATIAGMGQRFDAVISSHNLEHCNDPTAVIDAMFGALRPGGVMYLAFPSSRSVDFPSRKGCLNFYDDATHRTVPDFDGFLKRARRRGMRTEFAARSYRPVIPAVIGWLLEPLSASRGQCLARGVTWAYWGFESVIWFKAPAD